MGVSPHMSVYGGLVGTPENVRNRGHTGMLDVGLGSYILKK
jgi:hypothetical protein